MEKSTQSWVIYLSGPMTGIPQFNYPAFHNAATRLRAMGYSVVNPAEIDDHHTQKLALASDDGNAPMPWGQLIGRDISILCGSADEVVLLPGWENSRGALLEALAARFDNIFVSEIVNMTLSGDEDIVSVPDNVISNAISALLDKRSTNVHQAHQQTLLQTRG